MIYIHPCFEDVILSDIGDLLTQQLQPMFDFDVEEYGRSFTIRIKCLSYVYLSETVLRFHFYSNRTEYFENAGKINIYKVCRNPTNEPRNNFVSSKYLTQAVCGKHLERNVHRTS